MLLPPLNEQSAIANILSGLDRYLCALDALILTRMLVFVSKSHRKGLGKYGKNFKTKFR
nr:hypothetical protein [Helicobacter pylori]